MIDLRSLQQKVGDAVVFAGQGSQRLGMAKDFYERFDQSRRAFERASEVLGYDMARLCFEKESLLCRTEYAQPAILTAEIAIFEVLRTQFGYSPAYFAGHSLGEYAALVAAEVMRFEVALQIVAERGSLMQGVSEEGAGAMIALVSDSISHEVIEEICRSHDCEVSNYNSREQLVISGPKEEVESAASSIVSRFPEIRAVRFNVSAPFHSRLMRKIEKEFASVIERRRFEFRFSRAERVLSNYTGVFHMPFTLCAALVRQISAPVRWVDNMSCLMPITREILEISPQRVLAKFFRSVGRSIISISDVRGLDRKLGQERAYAV